MDNIFQNIDKNRDRELKELMDFCSLRSEYENSNGLKLAQEFIEHKLIELDLPYEKYNSGRPSDVLLARKSREGKPNLLMYNHYDVVTGGVALSDKNDAIKAFTKDGKIYARGVSDNKGGLLCRLQALRAIKEEYGEIPIGISLLYDNSEESGSETLKHMKKYNSEMFKKYLDADLCLWENGRTLPNKSPEAAFGVRASLSIMLKVKTSDKIEHGRMGAELPNAAFRLIKAISSLKDMEENILIEGFYNDVLESTDEDLRILKNYPYNEMEMLNNNQLSHFLLSLSGIDLKKRIFLSPLLNVNDIYCGRYGEKIENIIPNEAMARISIILVPNQTGEDILCKFKNHLIRNGFEDVEVMCKAEGFPVRTATNSKWADVLASAAMAVYDEPLIISLTQLGSGPGYIFREINPNLPIIATCGVASLDSGHHSTNENVVIENYLNGIKYTVATILEMARLSGSKFKGNR